MARPRNDGKLHVRGGSIPERIDPPDEQELREVVRVAVGWRK